MPVTAWPTVGFNLFFEIEVVVTGKKLTGKTKVCEFLVI
tara:strand:+ start:477 stop:593 length:117 start_codon:yes stop_codon:yes gene_type:complete